MSDMRKTLDIWTQATDDVTEALMNSLDRFNSIYMMANSGARGNKQQIRQLAGIEGPYGRPIRKDYRPSYYCKLP